MELRDVRYFAVIAENKNLGRAAESLNLSITALSKSLRRLEVAAGVRLVQRTPTGIKLTAAGLAFLARAGALEGVMTDLQREAVDLASGRMGKVHVGCNRSASENVVACASVTLACEAPGVELEITPASSGSLAGAMNKGEMDFCVSPRYPGVGEPFPMEQFVIEPLYRDRVVVIAAAEHRLAKQKSVTALDLMGERWAIIAWRNQPWNVLELTFEQLGLPHPKLSICSRSQAVRLAAVAYSNHLSVTTELFLRQEAVHYPLVSLPFKLVAHQCDVSIIYRRDAYLSPLAQRFIAVLRKQAKAASINSI